MAGGLVAWLVAVAAGILAALVDALQRGLP